MKLQKLPAVETIGKLEPVTHFDGAMLTGVTVSHQGRIFVNSPAGYIYATNYEHQVILRRSAQGEWETVVHDPRR